MLNAYDAHPAGPPETLQWSARVRFDPAAEPVAVAYLRDHALRLFSPLSFKPSGDPAPSALEALLAAVGGELITGFAARCRRDRLILDALEARVVASLENPLLAAGVIGESGSPAIASLSVTLYIDSPEPEVALHRAFEITRTTLPVIMTLARACTVALNVQYIS